MQGGHRGNAMAYPWRRSVERHSPILSCPAKAGHPVITDVRAKSLAAAITGSSAFRDDDKKCGVAALLRRGAAGLSGEARAPPTAQVRGPPSPLSRGGMS